MNDPAGGSASAAPGRSASQVWRVSLAVPESSIDALAGALYLAGHEGIEILDPAPGESAVRVRVYALARCGTEEIARAAARVPDCAVAVVEAVDLEDWAEGWKRHFVPIEIGRGLVVLPPWASPARHPGRAAVVVEPGHAFGTGTHASTRLVLESLEQVLGRLPARGPVIDLGTGSGILAIAAVRLGLVPVLAIDHDGEAVEEARENVRRNGVQRSVRCLEGDASDVPDGTRLLPANLSAPVHRGIAGLLAPRIAPGGRALLAGLLADEVDGVARAWPGRFSARTAERDGWALLDLTAPER
jgi:ribosomal protein L11 methyltransferase